LEDDYEKNYGGFDPNSLEGYIALAMSQTGFRDHSIAFAKSVQDQMRERVGMKDRSVKEAGFMVLYMTAMPGVLIETGFISNGTEEKFLGSKEGQSYIASAIYRAVRDYKNSVEKGNARTIKVEEKKDPVVIKEKKDNNSTQTKEEKTPEEKKPVNTESNDKQAGDEPKVEETKEVKSKPVVVKKEEQVKDSSTKDEVYFAIQVKSHSKPLSLNHLSFKGRKDVFEYKHNGFYKYAVGKTVSYSKAFALMKELRRGEFKDAFLIAFNNKSRIPAEKARELLKKN
jgi:N-acetylmuramoyl-L-alanine amidase